MGVWSHTMAVRSHTTPNGMGSYAVPVANLAYLDNVLTRYIKNALAILDLLCHLVRAQSHTICMGLDGMPPPGLVVPQRPMGPLGWGYSISFRSLD